MPRRPFSPEGEKEQVPTSGKTELQPDSRCIFQSIGSVQKIGKHPDQVLHIDRLVQPRRSLQGGNIKLTTAISGNSYERYLSRDQGLGEPGGQVPVQIEIQHNGVGAAPFKDLQRFGLSSSQTDHITALAPEPIFKVHCQQDLVFDDQNAGSSQSGRTLAVFHAADSVMVAGKTPW